MLALLGYSTQNGAFTDNHLVAGGAFTHANGGLCNYVAQWTESNQYPFNTWGTLGSGFNAGVDALEMFRGNIVAGGAFTLSGATSVNHIARWTGSAWQAMGSAMNGTVRALKTVSTLSVTTIIAAGDFTTANGAAANHIATWSENYVNLVSPWAPMGSGFNSTVFAVEKYGTSTYAGGQFTASGTTALNSIGRWTGSAWVQVGSATAGGGFNGPVYALRSEGGYLYAAGSFTSADGVPVQNVARWNGSVWSAVDVGTDAVAFALYPYHGEVLTGGNFTWAESNASSAYGVARFSENGIPWLARQPVSANVTQGQALFFSTQPASGYSNLTYQWRKDDVPLNDGTTPQGSSLRGTTTANLYVSNIVPADSGSYDCVVTNACGSITTTLATLGVTATTAVPFAGGPSDLGLTVHPNPARGSAEIDFHIPPATDAEADIYDSAGRRVRRLLAGTSLSAGEKSIHWDGKDDDGREVGAGVYYARVAAGGAVAVRKTAIVR